MKEIILYITTSFLIISGFSQSHKASISISGETQKRIDKYSKTYKIKKRHNTSPLESVDIKVKDEHKKLILTSKSDKNGLYDIQFNLEANRSYTLSFSKNGYFLKQFLFNTNGISINKHINFEKWDFFLYKRIIGLKDSIFIEPIVFYYDSERGFMTYDEEFNIPLTTNQELQYIDYLRNLNNNDFAMNEVENESTDTSSITEKDTEKKDTVIKNDLPDIQLINMSELLKSLSISNEEDSDSIITKEKDNLIGLWQQLEIAKAKAITTEDKNKIAEAEKLLVEKESQILQAQAEIENSKKLLEIQLTENKNKTNLLILGGVALVLVLALLLLVFRNNKERLKINNLLTQKNNEVFDSIKYAKRIQNAILPPLVIIEKNLANSFVLYNPKDIVSGDFYWVENIGNKSLFAVVDCTGHGVPGAFMSIVAHNSLNQAVNMNPNSTPAEILNQVNLSITTTLHQSENIDVEDGMDISLCLLDTDTNELQFAGAHQPLYIVRNGKIIITKSDKYSIGSQKGNGKTYNNHSFKLEKNDVIYIFSDGYADQFGGANDKKFLYKRFKKLILDIQSKSMADQKLAINNQLMSWRGNLEQVDDVCVMGVKI